MRKIAINIIRGILVVMSKLPLKFHYFMGGIVTFFLKNVLRYRYSTIITNISRSFPDMKYGAIKKTASDFYRHLGDIIAETIWFSGTSYKRLHKQGLVTVTNPRHLSDVFAASPSMTVLSTHCGNWELMGGFLGYRKAEDVEYSFGEKEIHVVYKKLSSPVWDEVFKRNRASALEIVGTSCEIESTNILRFTMKHKDEKFIYIYPTDQAPYRKAARYDLGDFMNQPTKAMLGSVGLACKLSHAVVYMKMKHVERGKYEMSFITICEDASKYTPEEVMRKYYDLLEEEINETPHNWLWSHKRWK